jgi:para-nitrobenzyl esterase
MLLAGAALFDACGALAAGTDTLVVDTASGKLRGSRKPGVAQFLGIPYGQAARFQAPRPAPSWTGVRDALSFGPRAPQTDVKAETLPPSIRGFARFATEPMSEDCLVLNVWTPAADNRKRPVMVWFHGGGWTVGSGQEPDYHGANLARRNDVVVVTVNHRLNAFGYAYLGHVGDPRFADSGNAGMLDLVQALRWVKENIARFGGNPGNVTIFGQSGGGSKVSAMLAMPAGKGLYHKAIIMSGPGVRMLDRAAAEKMGDELLKKLGLDRASAAKLLDVPMAKIIGAAGVAIGGGGLNFQPVVDGRALPTHPFDPVATPVSTGIPLIIGTTANEMTSLMIPEVESNRMSDADLVKRIDAQVPGRGQEMAAGYRKLRPNATAVQLLADVLTDLRMSAGTDTLADRKVAQGGAPVWRYLVAWQTPYMNGILGAAHGEDMAMVFDNVEVARSALGPGPAPQRMADNMSRAFAAFARTGRPDHASIPHWQQYSSTRRETLVFDVPPRMANDPQAARRSLWAMKAA